MISNKISVLEALVAGLLFALIFDCFTILREFQSAYPPLFIIRYVLLFICGYFLGAISKKIIETKYYKFIIILLITLNIISLIR